MVYIPAGKFTMGSDDYPSAKPQHEVNKDLIAAAKRSDMPEVNRLVAKGGDVNAMDNDGSTAQTQHTSKSIYWKCPKCGALHEKGFGTLFDGASVIGVGTCGICGAKLSQSDIYGGEYDVEERIVDPVYKFRIIGSTAMWGDGHQITFNNEWTSTELNWLLDGTLFPVSSEMTKNECRELIEGNFPAAFQIALRSSQQFNLPTPKKSDGYELSIQKLHLSYAVRNNVAFPDAVRIFRTTMGM